MYSESDLFITGLDRAGAKVKMVARGAAKSTKRFGGGILEPTHLICAVMADREKDGVRTLVEAELINGFNHLRKDYSRLQVGLKFIEWVERIATEEAVDNHSLYDMLGHGLSQLEVAKDLRLLESHFLVRLFSLAGVLPDDPLFRPFLQIPVGAHQHLDFELDLQALCSRLELMEKEILRA